MSENHERWLALQDGTRMNYLDDGDGRPAILVHGWSGNNSSYAPFREELVQAGFRFLAPNMRGSKPTEHSKYLPATIMQLGDDLHYMIESLGLDNVTLLGHSQGGQDIMSYLCKYDSEHLQSVVLVDTTPANHNVPGFLSA